MQSFQIVVCGSIVPDPLQTLEPVVGAAVPSLKNEMMLPAVLDPWAAHAQLVKVYAAEREGEAATRHQKLWKRCQPQYLEIPIPPGCACPMSSSRTSR
jgi:hypothetical protein